MSRRITGLTALVPLLTVGGLVPVLLPGASAAAPTAADYPKAGCTTFSDITGDGTPGVAGPATFPNEPDLDLTGVAVQTKPDIIRAFISVDKLGDLPANFQGDRFEFEFLVGTKKFTFTAGRTSAVEGAVSDPNRGQVNGTTTADLKPQATFDKAHNTLVLDIDRAKLDKANGSPVGNGTVVTGVLARTFGLLPGLQFQADTAQAATAPAQIYTIGVSPCFGPPPAVLSVVSGTTSQYGDPAVVTAKLAGQDGAPLAGKRVSIGVLGKTVVATTDAKGLAKATIPLSSPAGSATLTLAFAGDTTADPAKISAPYSVTQERTRIILLVTRQGATRSLSALLADDDNHPVAGQHLSIAVNGKAVATLVTNAQGRVTYTKAKAGQTVKVTLAAVEGRYLGSTAQVKL